LTLRVIFGAAGKLVHRAVNLDGNTRAANGEVDRVTANVVLAHDVDAFVTQTSKCLPRAVFA